MIVNNLSVCLYEPAYLSEWAEKEPPFFNLILANMRPLTYVQFRRSCSPKVTLKWNFFLGRVSPAALASVLHIPPDIGEPDGPKNTTQSKMSDYQCQWP